MDINKTTYNKARRTSNGYQIRPKGRLKIRSVMVHTTNGRKGTTLTQEANYIANSDEISSHYLVGKKGEIIEFLDPELYVAYHAGCVKATAFSNPFCIGIEMHNTPSEGHCTDLQLYALDWLVLNLIEHFSIPKHYIETHRAVAVYCKGHKLAGKLGRKIDPSGFPDNEFYAWRDTLYGKQYRVISEVVNVRQSPQVNNYNIAGKLYKDDTFFSAVQKVDELGQYIKGVNIWAHLTRGTSRGKDVSGLGFVHTSNLAVIG